MEKRNSNLWIGLGIGSVIGALAYRFSRTSKAKRMKEKVCDAFQKITGQAKEMLDEAKEKAVETGKEVADDFKGKMHSMASDMKK